MHIYKDYKVPDTYEEIDDLNAIFNPPGIVLKKVQYIDFDKMNCTIVTVNYKKFKEAVGEARDIIIEEYLDIVHKYIDSKVPDPVPEPEYVEPVYEENPEVVTE